MKERENYIDTIAGILILNMVIYHYSPIEVQKYLGFFVTWFFYKSGLFFKVTPMQPCINKCKKLLIPFFLFSFIGYIIHSIRLLIEGDYSVIHYTLTPIKELLLNGAIEGNLPLWFLATLIVVKILYNYMVIKDIKKVYIMIVVFCICAFPHLAKFTYPEFFLNISNGIMFFCLGDLLKPIQDKKIVVLISTSIVMCIALLCMPKASVLGDTMIEGDYLIWLLYSVAGCIMINSIFRIMPYRFPVLSFIGRNSLIILVTHCFFLDLIDGLLPYMGFNLFDNKRLLVLYSLFIFGEILLFSLYSKKKISWVIGA